MHYTIVGLMRIKITFQDMCIVQTVKLQRFCQLGNGITALEIRCMPYLCCIDNNAG